MRQFQLYFIIFFSISFLIVNISYAQDKFSIWKEFVADLKNDKFDINQISPYEGLAKEVLMGFLSDMKEKALWEEWETDPEEYIVNQHIHYLIPLTFDEYKTTYCFTFLIEENGWYFRHLEALFIRLDKISSLPTSTFPDVEEGMKNWMREEIYWSKQIYLFNLLAEDKGKDFAFNYFRDGLGYLMGARTWVPFVPEQKAFILYLCWEQANLRGNTITLEKLDDNEAIVKMDLIYFKLYKNTGHLKYQISYEDYQKIFETIWYDRANNAGWNLTILYENEKCVFHFTKE